MSEITTQQHVLDTLLTIRNIADQLEILRLQIQSKEAMDLFPDCDKILALDEIMMLAQDIKDLKTRVALIAKFLITPPHDKAGKAPKGRKAK